MIRRIKWSSSEEFIQSVPIIEIIIIAGVAELDQKRGT